MWREENPVLDYGFLWVFNEFLWVFDGFSMGCGK